MLSLEQVKIIENAIGQGKNIVDLHPSQKIVWSDATKYRIVCSGRFFGKSILGSLETIKVAARKPNQVAYIVSPTYDMSIENIWYPLNQLIELIPNLYSSIEKISRRDLEIFLENGSRIKLRSANDPDKLRGARSDWYFLDEYSFMLKTGGVDVWGIIEPNIKSDGSALICSTPNGKDNFYKLWLKGQDPKNAGIYKSWQFKTIDNITDPGLLQKVKDAEQTSDPILFRQEYEASFETTEGKICVTFTEEDNTVDWKINDNTFIPNVPFNLVCDFNVNPECWCLTQIIKKEDILTYFPNYKNQQNLQDEILYVFKEFKTQNLNTDFTVMKVQDYLTQIGYNSYLNLFGDATGKNRNTTQTIDIYSGQRATDWTIIQKNIGYKTYLKIDNKNPSQQNRLNATRMKIRTIAGDIGVLVNQECTGVINDIQTVRYPVSGRNEIDKTLERQGIGHYFDGLGYQIQRLWDLNKIKPQFYVLDVAV